jgi:ATP-dependent Clp protease ATP-binding subunit ClpC
MSTGVDLKKMYTEILNISQQRIPPAPDGVGRQSEKNGHQNLDQLSRDLTERARSGSLDRSSGVKTKSARNSDPVPADENNPVLIGEPGVGKTPSTRASRRRIRTGDVPETLIGQRVARSTCRAWWPALVPGHFETHQGRYRRGHQGRGVVMFIDELHQSSARAAAEGAIDAANIIKPALGRGEIQVIAGHDAHEYASTLKRTPRSSGASSGDRQHRRGGVRDDPQGLRDKYEAHPQAEDHDEPSPAVQNVQ